MFLTTRYSELPTIRRIDQLNAVRVFQSHPKGPTIGKQDEGRRRLRAMQVVQVEMFRLPPLQAVRQIPIFLQRINLSPVTVVASIRLRVGANVDPKPHRQPASR